MTGELISWVVPTYNEPRIRESLLEAHRELSALLPGASLEFVVVDDSRDGTYEVLDGLRQEAPFAMRLIRGRKRGKGNAVRLGIEGTTGDVIFCADADFRIPLARVPEFVAAIRERGRDIAIG